MSNRECDSDTQYEDNTTLEYSIYWLQAIKYQGKRVFRARQASEGQPYPFLTTAVLEDHFFLVACIKARRWLEKLTRIAAEEKRPIDKFLVLTENAVVVRNKREHDDEYVGSGKKDQPVQMHEVETGASVKMTVGTLGTVFIDGKFLMGGIFDVRQAIEAAHSLLGNIVKLQHAYWDERRGADHRKVREQLVGDEFANNEGQPPIH